MLKINPRIIFFSFLTILFTCRIEAEETNNRTAKAKPEICSYTNRDSKLFYSGLKKILVKSKQLIVVSTNEWDETGGKLSFYKKENGSWKIIDKEIPVVIGKNGLGWGRGLIDFPKGIGPEKKEGDGRSPAGVFKLSSAFGYSPHDSVKWIKLPYLYSTESVECVDDSLSDYYNKLVDTNTTRKDWKSYEKMKLRNNLYKYGIFIDHNSNPAVRGSGSCIFFHIWSEDKTPSTGCTTLAENKLVELLNWLRPDKHPLLIQLPKCELEKITHLIK